MAVTDHPRLVDWGNEWVTLAASWNLYSHMSVYLSLCFFLTFYCGHVGCEGVGWGGEGFREHYEQWDEFIPIIMIRQIVFKNFTSTDHSPCYMVLQYLVGLSRLTLSRIWFQKCGSTQCKCLIRCQVATGTSILAHGFVLDSCYIFVATMAWPKS